MRLSDHLDERFVSLELKGASRDEAISELAELLEGNPDVMDSEKYLADILAREEEASTDLGRGAAMSAPRAFVSYFLVGQAHG